VILPIAVGAHAFRRLFVAEHTTIYLIGAVLLLGAMEPAMTAATTEPPKKTSLSMGRFGSPLPRAVVYGVRARL
jgi:hypothetical protein